LDCQGQVVLGLLVCHCIELSHAGEVIECGHTVLLNMHEGHLAWEMSQCIAYRRSMCLKEPEIISQNIGCLLDDAQVVTSDGDIPSHDLVYPTYHSNAYIPCNLLEYVIDTMCPPGAWRDPWHVEILVVHVSLNSILTYFPNFENMPQCIIC